MSVFSDWAKKYYDMGYYPFPTSVNKNNDPTELKKLKAPFTFDRSVEKYSFDKIMKSSLSRSNIGIGVGHSYGIVAIDIDTPNKYMGGELEKQIRSILPTSPLNRVGQLGRSLYFFKSSEKFDRSINASDDNGDTWVEFLTNGKFVIVPPSIHPTGRVYSWVEDNLLDYYIEDLPELTENIYNIFDNVSFMIKNSVVKLSGKRKSGGRNNLLTSYVSAKIADGKDFSTIVNEIIEHDLKHDVPLFSDSSENKGRTDTRTNAMRFVSSISNRILSDPKFISKPLHEIITIGESKPITISYKEKKLPHLRGIMKEFFDYVYVNSPIQRSQFSFASSLLTFATIVGNKCRYGRLLPNMYALMITHSGMGKDFPLKFGWELFSKANLKNLIGEGAPASDTALMQNLTNFPIRLDRVDEIGGKLFSTFNTSNNNSYQKRIEDVYAELYSSAGQYFSGKSLATAKDRNNPNDQGRIGECQNPYVCLLGATTIESFKLTFSPSIIQQGLGARFLYFADDENKKKNHSDYVPLSNSLLRKVESIAMTGNELDLTNKIPELSYSTPFKKAVYELDDYYYDKSVKFESLTPMRPLYNRAGEQLQKLMQLDCMSNDSRTLTMDNLDWAKKAIDAILHNENIFLDKNLTSGFNDYWQKIIEDSILQAGKKGLQLSTLARGSSRCLTKNQRRDFLSDLLEKDLIIKEKTHYIHTKYIL